MNTKTEGVTLNLTIDLIMKAMQGQPDALEYILKLYDNYINAFCRYETFDADGIIHTGLDEDMKVQIQNKLLDAIQHKWRPMI